MEPTWGPSWSWAHVGLMNLSIRARLSWSCPGSCETIAGSPLRLCSSMFCGIIKNADCDSTYLDIKTKIIISKSTNDVNGGDHSWNNDVYYTQERVWHALSQMKAVSGSIKPNIMNHGQLWNGYSLGKVIFCMFNKTTFGNSPWTSYSILISNANHSLNGPFVGYMKVSKRKRNRSNQWPATDGFPSQRASNGELWCLLCW